jgi:hypothetical protein
MNWNPGQMYGSYHGYWVGHPTGSIVVNGQTKYAFSGYYGGSPSEANAFKNPQGVIIKGYLNYSGGQAQAAGEVDKAVSYGSDPTMSSTLGGSTGTVPLKVRKAGTWYPWTATLSTTDYENYPYNYTSVFNWHQMTATHF